MKIICVDNFNRDTVSDRLVAQGITDKSEAAVMVGELNKRFSSETAWDYYKLVEDDYKLYVYDPT